MSIVTRFGADVELLRPVRSLEELPPEEDRDELARERIELGQWFFATLSVDGEDLPGERVVDLALCRADGGSLEIAEAADRLR